MGDFLGSYYSIDAPSSKLALLRAEQPVSVLAMDAIQPSHSEKVYRPTTHDRWTALESLHVRDVPSDALVPQAEMRNMPSLDCMVIEKAEHEMDVQEMEIPVASMSLFEPATGLVTLPLSRSRLSGQGVNEEDLRRVPCAPGDSPMPKLHRVCDVDMVDATVPVPVQGQDFANVRVETLKSASLRSSLMRFISRRGLK